MIDIEKKHLEIVKKILNKYPYKFYAFGSRAKGIRVKKYSDLDLCYRELIPLSTITEIMDELTESDLPFKVDLVNYDSFSPEIKKIIAKDLKVV